MSVVDKIQKVREVIEGIVAIISPINEVFPIIDLILSKLPEPVQQAYPPEVVKQIIDDFEAKEKAFDEKFLPPEDEENIENIEIPFEEDGDDGSDE